MRKPEIGIKPRHINDVERFNEIREAMARFSNSHQAIPLEWIEEYNELVVKINERKKPIVIHDKDKTIRLHDLEEVK